MRVVEPAFPVRITDFAWDLLGASQQQSGKFEITT
jgi:hypothetical protein